MSYVIPRQEAARGWTRRYEELREQALAGGGPIATDSMGLSVLTRQGVFAWMQAWHDPLSSSLPIAGEGESRPVNPGVSWQREATVLLANMAFHHLTRSLSNS